MGELLMLLGLTRWRASIRRCCSSIAGSESWRSREQIRSMRSSGSDMAEWSPASSPCRTETSGCNGGGMSEAECEAIRRRTLLLEKRHHISYYTLYIFRQCL